MTLEQLRVFVAVAERGHLTRAAEALHISQSAASAAIAALETRHGVRLFDRIGRGLQLSQAGRALLPEARAVLAQATSATQVLADLAGLKRGVVRVFASQTVASYWLPPHIVQFRLAHPGIEVRLSAGNTVQAVQAVIDGDADLGVVEGAVEAPLLDRRIVGGDRLAIVTAPDHPWAASPPASAADLIGSAWALREEGSGTRSAFEQALRDDGVDPAGLTVILEAPSNEAVLAAVRSSGLAAMVSELAAAPMLRAGELRRIPFDLPARAFQLVRHRERYCGRAAEAFIQHMVGPAAGRPLNREGA